MGIGYGTLKIVTAIRVRPQNILYESKRLTSLKPTQLWTIPRYPRLFRNVIIPKIAVDVDTCFV